MPSTDTQTEPQRPRNAPSQRRRRAMRKAGMTAAEIAVAHLAQRAVPVTISPAPATPAAREPARTTLNWQPQTFSLGHWTEDGRYWVMGH